MEGHFVEINNKKELHAPIDHRDTTLVNFSKNEFAKSIFTTLEKQQKKAVPIKKFVILVTIGTISEYHALQILWKSSFYEKCFFFQLPIQHDEQYTVVQ